MTTSITPRREAPPPTRHRLPRFVGWAITLVVLPILVITPLALHQQLTLSIAIFIAALVLDRFPGRFPTLAMIFLSVIVSSRYMYWRLTETLYMDNLLDLVLGTGLIGAAIYAFVVLLLGYIQTAWPLERKPHPLPEDTRQWPPVDVFIPTYNEPLSVVRPTVPAAQSIDWQNQPLFTQWAARMPLRRAADAKEFHLGIDDSLNLITGTGQREDLPATTQMTVAEESTAAVLAGFESPLQKQRSVVAVLAGATSQPALLDALMSPSLVRNIQGSSAFVNGDRVSSLLTGDTYHVGRLPPVTWLQWKLSRHPLLLAAGVVALAFIGAAAACLSLQLRARRRLR